MEQTGLTADRFDFSGQGNMALSFDHAISLKGYYIYGEGAWNPGGGFALTEGIKLSPAPGTVINLHYTNIMKGYNSFHGIASGKETVGNFRESIIVSISTEPVAGLKVVTGIEHISEKWYDLYGTPPGQRYRYETELSYNHGGEITLSVRLKQRIVDNSISAERGLRETGKSKYSNIRLSGTYRVYPSLSLQARAEFVLRDGGNPAGYLFYNGLRYTAPWKNISLYARAYIWSTRDYASRIYAWEDDLLYSSSFNPFYSDGRRIYLMASVPVKGGHTVRVKYGCSLKNEEERGVLPRQGDKGAVQDYVLGFAGLMSLIFSCMVLAPRNSFISTV
ncbi:MAG: hypothetical protein R2727_06525 [Bacteroidales bacterium]